MAKNDAESARRATVQRVVMQVFPGLTQYDIEGPHQHPDGFRFEIDLKADADSHVELSYRKLKQLSERLGTDLIHVKTQFGYDISEVTPGPCDSCKLEVIVC